MTSLRNGKQHPWGKVNNIQGKGKQHPWGKENNTSEVRETASLGKGTQHP